MTITMNELVETTYYCMCCRSVILVEDQPWMNLPEGQWPAVQGAKAFCSKTRQEVGYVGLDLSDFDNMKAYIEFTYESRQDGEFQFECEE